MSLIGRLTAFVSDTTMALVEHGALLGPRQSDIGNPGLDLYRQGIGEGMKRWFNLSEQIPSQRKGI